MTPRPIDIRPDRPVCPDFDADTERPYAMASPCDTCVLRRGGSSLVAPAVVRDLVRRHVATGSVITCHKTLPDIPGNAADRLPYAACRGFLDAFGDRVQGARIVPALSGGWHDIDPPPKGDDP